MKFIIAVETDETDTNIDLVRPMRLEYHLNPDASIYEYHVAYLAFLRGRTFCTNRLQKLLLEDECVCTPTEED